MMRGRRLAGAIVAGALLSGGAVVSGCGSSDDGGTTNLGVLEQAASRTAAQKSFHMSMRIEQSLMGTAYTVLSEGDYAGGRGRLTLDFGGVRKLLAGVPGAEAGLTKLGGDDAFKATMLVDGTTLLVRSVALQKGLKQFAGKDVPAWASLDTKKLGDTLGIDVGSLFAGSTGSDQLIAYMRALTGSLDKVGSEKIDGVDTTHYRGTLDLANIPKGSVPPAMQKSMRQIADLMKKTGASTKNPVDVWVGEDGLVRREIVTQKIQSTSSRTTVNFTDYGRTKAIALPAAAQRFDALALVDELAPGALKSVAGLMKSGGLGGLSAGGGATHPEISVIK